MRNSKFKAVAIFLMPLLFLVTGCAREAQELKIGAILPLTGDAASWGERGKKGIDLAIKEINERGGIKGRKLRVIYEDTQASPKLGAAAMKKLATIDKVPVVIGDIVSATTLAAAPIAEKNKVVLLSPTASAPAITQAGDFIFRIWPSDLAEGTAMAKFAWEQGFRNVGVLYIQNDYGVGLKDVFSKKFSQLGGSVPMALGYKPDETDFRSYLTKLKRAGPEAIYLISYYKDGALAVKQARELGVELQFLGTTAIEDPKFLELAGQAAEGLIYPLASGYDPKSEEEIVQKFKANFKKLYGEEPGFVEAQCYDAVKVVAHSIREGGFTGPEIQKAMAKIEGFKGVTGVITFNENGDVIKPVTMKVIKGGKFQVYQR